MTEQPPHHTHNSLQDIKNRLAVLEEADHNSEILAKYAKIRVIVAYGILFATAVMFLLIFTALGDWVSFKTGWVIPNAGGPSSAAHQVNTEAVVSATRNMITVIAPILIGIVIWLITITAERRLKAYDETMQNFRGEIREGISEARETTLATVQGSIKEQVREVVETEKQRLDDAIKNYRKDLQRETENVESIRKGIEARFGHIADNSTYAAADSNFGELTSVGAVNIKVGELFGDRNRAQAILLVREMLNLFHREDGAHRPSGSLTGDWFNLSTELGRHDEESLALEVCLAGLQQQASAPIFDESGNLIQELEGQGLNDDLLALAIQYAQTVNDARLSGLLSLNRYDENECKGPPEWGWRSYTFTIKALNSLNRHDEAIKLGLYFLEEVPLDGDTNKVLQDLMSVMAAHGDRPGAIDLAQRWLAEHPYAPGAQVITQLLDWLDADEDTEHYIALASRGIRDLAEEQASSNLGNIYFRRALARDKRALNAVLSSRNLDLNICDEIRLALNDFAMARDTDVNPRFSAQILQREKVLRHVATDLGCDMGNLLNKEGPTGDRDFSGDPGSAATQQAFELLPIISSDGMTPEDKADVIHEKLKGADPTVRRLTYAFLANMKDDDDIRDELRAALRGLWPHISANR